MPTANTTTPKAKAAKPRAKAGAAGLRKRACEARRVRISTRTAKRKLCGPSGTVWLRPGPIGRLVG